MFFESIKMSWDNIVNNKLRSFLTMLGIVIGVSSIIALITIVQGATNRVEEQMSSLGVNKVMVTAMGNPLKQGLSESDIKDIKNIKNVNSVSPTISKKTSIINNGQILENINIEGKNEVYFNESTTLLKSGRAINIMDIESKNQVAIIGDDIVNEFFYGVNPIGNDIMINGTTYKIIGTLTNTTAFSMNSNNDAVVIPYTTALSNLGVKNVVNLDVYLDNTDLANETVLDIKALLNVKFNYKDDSYTVFNMGDIIDSFNTMMSMMSLLLTGIAAISLIVGGVGIMNMMLVSITERTFEIGLRKALGATPNRIQLQFIIESIFLSIIGGFIGILFGGLIAYILAAFIDINFAISYSTILLAVCFSALVGIVFGYMPARKASKLNPIDALRSL